MVACVELHIIELIPVHCRRAECTDLPCPDQRIKCLHGFPDGSGRIKAVDDIKVEIVRPESAQCAVNLPGNCLCGKISLVKVNFGGKDNPVARDAVFDCPAQILFTCPMRIGVCRIKKIDSQIQCMTDNRFGLFRIQRLFMKIRRGFSKAHATDTEFRYFNAGFSEFRIFHTRPAHCFSAHLASSAFDIPLTIPPRFHTASGQTFFSTSTVFPIPLPPLVANGIRVFPEKS